MKSLYPRALPVERIAQVRGFGPNRLRSAYLYRPSSVDEVAELFDLAQATCRPLALRGTGLSYGDAATNTEGIVVDMAGLNRIQSWDAKSGLITVEPGVTIRQVWERVLPDGWWPPVVPGTMYPTVAGCLAMNVHGKNNFCAGPIGDHVESFELRTTQGETLICSRQMNTDVFRGAIGGFGMLGFFASITLRMKRVYSGLLDVVGVSTRNLAAMLDQFDERRGRVDYLVGWIDGFAQGRRLGRGVMHQATHLAEGEDPNPTSSMGRHAQELPERLFGVLPNPILWRIIRPLLNNVGVKGINYARYLSGRLFDGTGRAFRQSHVAFAFLLDYIPDWRLAYGTGGLIQYQSFIPADAALEVFTDQLRLAQRAGYPPYLSVFKRHRPDHYLMSHGVDGYSLAMDFKLTARNLEALWRLAREFDRIALSARGRLYMAKDSTMTPETARAFLGDSAIREFNALRERLDPQQILGTDLFRRLFNRGHS